MWQALSGTRRASPEFQSSARELVQSTLRLLILSVGGLYLGWHFFATATWPGETAESVWLVTALMLTTSGIALALTTTHLTAAAVVWQAGVGVTITVAILLFRQPPVALAYAVLPFTSAVIFGAPWGLGVEGAITLAAWGIHMRTPMLPASTVAAASALGALLWVVGWASSHTLSTVTNWSLFAWTEARRKTEDARQHRAQLARVVKDLDQAYYRLQRANADLVAAWKTADEAERLKAELVATVSHELRTPLNLVIGFAEMMIASPESYGGVPIPGPYRGDLNAIYHSAQHLLQLVDDVLDLSRIEAGRIGLTMGQVDLRALVVEAVGMVQDYVTAKGLKLAVHLPPDLPEVRLDRLRIRQVLLNLLVNAARFTDRGGISVDVTLHDQSVRVSVTDTGRGIPEKDLARVFEEYRPKQQEETGWHSGAGLGLPISKKLVELHRGQIGVASPGTGGTTFWFTLPLTTADAERQAGALTRKSVPTIKRDEQTVILQHDDVALARILDRYLDGYRVLPARNTAEAASLVETAQAIAVISANQQTPAELPAHVLSIACPLPSRRQAAAELGAFDLLIKPIGKDELIAAIDSAPHPVSTLLMADDDPEMIRLVRRFLTGHRTVHNSLEAHTGAEAMRLIAAEHPDLVLLDLVMPEMDGRQILSRMATQPDLADIPVIVISAKADDYITSQLTGPVHIERREGFDLGEVVKIVQANLAALTHDRG